MSIGSYTITYWCSLVAVMQNASSTDIHDFYGISSPSERMRQSTEDRQTYMQPHPLSWEGLCCLHNCTTIESTCAPIKSHTQECLMMGGDLLYVHGQGQSSSSMHQKQLRDIQTPATRKLFCSFTRLSRRKQRCCWPFG